MSKQISQSELKEVLHYDLGTGQFTWLVSRGSIRRGTIAGANNGDGQIRIGLNGRGYCAHQLAWLYVTGMWPLTLIDHRDLDRSNNRWTNLRAATKSDNMGNRHAPTSNRSGIKGVFRHTQYDRWCAQICRHGKRKHLGVFTTKEEAGAAYAAAAKESFGEFARTE